MHFNPRSPWGERLRKSPKYERLKQFQSTLPVGGATIIFLRFLLDIPISIHAPRGGSDASVLLGVSPPPLFQSTLPVGGATSTRSPPHHPQTISIHAPRGGSDDVDPVVVQGVLISIHAPRGGSDGDPLACISAIVDFNPRSPWGERLQSSFSMDAPPIYFNPRSPWGERPDGNVILFAPDEFQSTLPVGGATARVGLPATLTDISIHAPRGGSDCSGP